MTNIFNTIDKIKPAYDMIYRIVLFTCKILLIIVVLITAMAVAGRYVGFLPDPSWTEEVVLTCMAYTTVLSAALAIRKRTHIRMTAFDKYLPEKMLLVLNIVADFFVMILAFIMIVVGWRYAVLLGSRGSYVSLPSVSRFWMYFPVPLAGIAMVIFEIEAMYNDFKLFFQKKEVNNEC